MPSDVPPPHRRDHDPHLGAALDAPRTGAVGRPPKAAARRGAIRPRALVGGVLCAVSALGLWWAFERSAVTPETSYVVARRALTPGAVVGPADVALVPIHLPVEIAATVFSRSDDAVGGVVLSAVAAGELIAAGDVAAGRFAQGRLEGHAISLEFERARALNGLLVPGERVDVVATARNVWSPGLAETTQASAEADVVTAGFDSSVFGSVVAGGALVLDLDAGDGLGDSVVVTLQVGDLATATELAAASDGGSLTIIRDWRPQTSRQASQQLGRQASQQLGRQASQQLGRQASQQASTGGAP